MFAHRIPRARKLAALYCRHSSQLSSKYPFQKLRAFPFHISPEEAILDISPFAAAACLSPKIWSAYAAKLFPRWGFEPFRPVQIKPVYFPAWVIDGELSAEMLYGDKKHRATGYVESLYMPGCDFRVLSWVHLSAEKKKKAVPFTTDLEVQHNTEVICLPYNISPLSAFNLMRSIPYEKTYVQEDLRFKPSTIQHGLLAAYPILIPLYLAQYEIHSFLNEPQLLTVFIEASKHKAGTIHMEKLHWTKEAEFIQNRSPTLGRIVHNVGKLLDDFDVVSLRYIPSSSLRVHDFSVAGRDGVASAVASQLLKFMQTRSSSQDLAQATGAITSDDDLRIRPYDREERVSIVNFLEINKQIRTLKGMITALEKAQSMIGPDKSPGALGGTMETLQSSLNKLEATRHAITPSWWSEWLKMSQVDSQS